MPNPDDEKQAQERYAIIQPLLEYKADPARYSSLRLSNGHRVTSYTRMLTYIAEQHGTAERTLKRWIARFQQGSYAALADKRRSDAGMSRFFQQYPDAGVLAAYVYLEQRQSIRTAYKAILRERYLLHIPEAELPSYETVRAALAHITPALTTLARQGKTKYRELMAPYIQRGYEDVAANEIWISDHMIHDVEVMNDCFPEAPWGAPIRLRFTCLLDFRSRYVVGTSWAWEGSSRSIATALRHAVLSYGPPLSFYCDNGKDYLKVAKGALPGYLRDRLAPADWVRAEMDAIEHVGILARLHVSVTHCIVRHPQSKHVERFFGTLHRACDMRFPTYTGGTPDRRPDLTADAMAHHRKLIRHGLVEQSLHPRASQFIAMVQAWIEEYHNTPHSGRGMDGRTPAEVFAQERCPARPIPAAADLALLLFERERRMVSECAITLNKRRYVSCDQESSQILHDLNRRDVIVCYDPNDADYVAVLDEQGHYLCMAQAETLLTQSHGSYDAIAASMQERKHLEKQARQTLRGVTLAARQLGARSEVEVLAEKARMLPTSVDDHLTHRPQQAEANDAPAAPLTPAQAARLLMEGMRK